ncbi:MAG: branched-chain amino acid ABC transporter permease [Spirochaetes bacterium]|nr:branched-chain amino acid ABC transporter permease [Spirochaetota bacterium]HPA72187.1 branched-chain amino acid ABC transporter permease [Spirochaetota bacterium]
MPLENVVQYLLSGITTGSVYAIIAIGFNIIYNTTGIINFAQGEFLMLGGMISITLAQFMPLPAAIAGAVLITAGIGFLIELSFIRWIKEPTVLRMIIITVGLSIIIREAALHVWDEKVRALPYFTGNEITSMEILGARFSPQILWVLATCAVIVVMLNVFYSYTLTGKSMRACASNRTAASLCGINIKNMVSLSFVLSAAIGALAGCVISPITQTQYDCGTSLAIKGFTAAILGGLGSSNGAIVAGLAIGVIEAASISVIPLAYKDAITLTLLLFVLVLKPSGLFGSREAGALKEF